MMVKAVQPDKPAAEKSGSTAVLLLTLADTTWRILVPTLILALLGLKLDITWHSAPWLTLIGTALGFGLAGLLIKRQLEEVK